MSKEGFMILKENLKRSELNKLILKSVGDKDYERIQDFLDQEFTTVQDFRVTTGSMYSRGKTSFYSRGSGSKFTR
jgi:hypothetical protein